MRRLPQLLDYLQINLKLMKFWILIKLCRRPFQLLQNILKAKYCVNIESYRHSWLDLWLSVFKCRMRCDLLSKCHLDSLNKTLWRSYFCGLLKRISKLQEVHSLPRSSLCPVLVIFQWQNLQMNLMKLILHRTILENALVLFGGPQFVALYHWWLLKALSAIK